ncbi:CPBP family intramembrane glutamic endopeptidase [Prolixibacter denitrificans]|uniref:Protease n=1 Tax=Prolixibacter denitrificans TaxID=1541063 RepID=A0A2P8CFG8_9BACT|nr:type II CAAX endopeptidase family protein [Prolixibacter denitrificans]PSK83727.1 hypothetical protein CLV93_103142 [Prolixibacter denitrificans]GET23271.1 protease [Prolixibacter denitrificans]
MNEKSAKSKTANTFLVVGKIVLFLVLYIVASVFMQAMGLLAMQVPFTDQDAMQSLSTGQNLVIMGLTVIGVFLVVWIFRKAIDKKSIKSLGFSFQNGPRSLLYGLLFAVVIIGGGTLLLYATGHISLQQAGSGTESLGLSFLLFILVALNEEVVMRGYVLNTLMGAMNKFLALVISAVLFAAAHSLNPNVSFLGLTNIFLAGILLGASYIYTRNLWFPISLHLFWNFIQGPVIGYEVSGSASNGIFKVVDTGNQLINGGSFGFEGSLICTMLIIPAIVLVVWHQQRRTTPEAAVVVNEEGNE